MSLKLQFSSSHNLNFDVAIKTHRRRSSAQTDDTVKKETQLPDCGLLGYDIVWYGGWLPTFRNDQATLSSLPHEEAIIAISPNHRTLRRVLQDGTPVHRQIDAACYENDTRARARLRFERVATTHPASIRTVHSLTTRYSKCLMFSVCV